MAGLRAGIFWCKQGGTMSFEWIAILAYLAIQLGIGIYVSKRIASEKDYFLAGRSLGIWLASFSIFATWFGAETCMGSSGAIFEDGLSGSRADPFGYSFCLFFMGLFLARQLWKRQLTTLADLFRMRYGRLVEKIAVIILIPSSIIWAAAQIRAFGQIVASVTPFDVEWGVFLASMFVIAYTFLGGLLGDVITDFVQGGILMIGLIFLAVFAFWQLDGWAAIQAVEPSRWSFTSEGESFWARLDSWMIPILGSLVAQELLSRVLACKSATVAWKASMVACVIYLSVGLIPVFLGLIGPQLGLSMDDSEQFLPILAKGILPPVLYVIFMGALISAILSTVDSTLLTVSALTSHNLLAKWRFNQTESQKLKTARSIVVLAGLVGFVLAFYADGIYELVEMASSFGTAGVLIITFFGIYSRFGGRFAAAVTLVVGLVATPVFEYVLEVEAPFISAIGLSLVSFIVAGASSQLSYFKAWTLQDKKN